MINHSYYSERLSADRLEKCYDLAPPRVRQYLSAEIDYILTRINPGDLVLELGCGYGRVIHPISEKAKKIIGIDLSFSSLKKARLRLRSLSNLELINMDAVKMAFRNNVFDKIVCIQNGISAFHVNPNDLIKESIRVAKPGGKILYSSYSEKFWDHRLEWFRLQSDAGLIGEIDFSTTGSGTIICRDGFRATTYSEEDFRELTAGLKVRTRLHEVDESSLFCEMVVT
jgi:2-polyprenyl-6-hydroxyphenyl methylase/3-demethylubiquinone-9 3-methyltransferase